MMNDDDDDAGDRQPAVHAFIEKLTFRSRFVLIFGNIDHNVARVTCERIIALAEESDKPIKVLVSSPGGHVESGDCIHDIVKFVRAPVTMIGTGWVASAGTHIFLGVPKERRLCLPNTRFLIHQPSGGIGGKAVDIEIQMREIIKMKERIARVIATETGKDYEKVLKDIDRDYWMGTQEAMEYGIISRVINHHTDIDG